jgi:hypothetical protein
VPPAPALEEILAGNPILLVVDPKQSLQTNEMQAITAFLDKGGRAAFLMEPNPPAGWTNLFAHLGLQPLLRHTLVDPEYKDTVAGPNWFNAHIYPSPLTAGFANRVERIDPEDGRILYFSVLLSHTLGFIALSNQPPGLETYPVAGTSTNGWAESRYEADKPYEAEYSKDRDLPGPVPACWVIRHKRQPEGMRVFLSGDADFISDLHFQTKYSNWTFFRAMLNWLQNPATLSIKPRPVNRRTLMNLS